MVTLTALICGTILALAHLLWPRYQQDREAAKTDEEILAERKKEDAVRELKRYAAGRDLEVNRLNDKIRELETKEIAWQDQRHALEQKMLRAKEELYAIRYEGQTPEEITGRVHLEEEIKKLRDLVEEQDKALADALTKNRLAEEQARQLREFEKVTRQYYNDLSFSGYMMSSPPSVYPGR